MAIEEDKSNLIIPINIEVVKDGNLTPAFVRYLAEMEKKIKILAARVGVLEP